MQFSDTADYKSALRCQVSRLLRCFGIDIIGGERIRDAHGAETMKTTLKSLGAIILGGGLFISGCAKKRLTLFQSLKNPELAAQLKSFVAEKEAQAKAATNKMPSEFKAFFAVAAKGDWLAVSNAFTELRGLRKQAGQYNMYERSGKTDEPLRGTATAWQAALETWGALEAFGEGDEKYPMLFGTNIIASIPAGSIYFGGTDAGCFIINSTAKVTCAGGTLFHAHPGWSAGRRVSGIPARHVRRKDLHTNG